MRDPFAQANCRRREDWRDEIVLRFGGGGSSSEPAGNTTTTQTSAPWAGQQPYLTQGFSAAQSLYDNPSEYPQYYPGTQVAPLNTTQQAGITQEANLGQQGNSSVNAANSYLTNELSGAYMPENNPYLGTMESQAVDSVMPGLESQFAQGNAMNEPGAAYAVGQGVGGALGNVYGNMYQSDLSNMNTAAMWGAPAMENAGLQNAQATLSAGGQEQTQSQNEINAAMNQWNYNQTLPENMLNYYQGLVGGNYGSTSSLTSPYFEPSTSSQVLGGLSTLAPFALALTTLSDRRSKHIKKEYAGAVSDIDRMEVVRAHYLWEDEDAERPMLVADNLQEVLPKAVVGEKDAKDGNGNPLYQLIDAAQLVPVLVGAVKELSARVRALESADA